MSQVAGNTRSGLAMADGVDEAGAIVDAIRSGDRRTLARALTLAEGGGPLSSAVQRRAAAFENSAYVVGITGPPGAGKSTLTAAIIDVVRRNDASVAALAVDPTSPLSGGAVLGDRIRMQRHAADRGAFIRSVASRGQSGGLALSTPLSIRLLGTAGYEWIVLETVGIGQIEVDIAKTADTTVVVLNPGGGDDVQATKGGLLEVADVLVVNKADREGAAKTRRELKQMLSITRLQDPGWAPPVILTVADSGEGLDELWEAIESHKAHLETNHLLSARRARKGEVEVRAALKALLDHYLSMPGGAEHRDGLYDAVARGELDALAAAVSLLDGVALASEAHSR